MARNLNTALVKKRREIEKKSRKLTPLPIFGYVVYGRPLRIIFFLENLQARAKTELREIATEEDAKDAVEIFKTCMMETWTNEEGVLDVTRSFNGAGMSSQNQVGILFSTSSAL